MKATQAVTLAVRAMTSGAVDNGERSHCLFNVRFVVVRFTANYKLAIKKKASAGMGAFCKEYMLKILSIAVSEGNFLKKSKVRACQNYLSTTHYKMQ